MSKELNAELHNLKKEFEAMKASIKKISMEELPDFSREHLKELASQMMDDLNSFVDDKKEDYLDAKAHCAKTIKSNPFTYVLGAFAVGAIVGMILKK